MNCPHSENNWVFHQWIARQTVATVCYIEVQVSKEFAAFFSNYYLKGDLFIINYFLIGKLN